MVNKKLLIGLAIICGQVANNQAITNVAHVAWSGAAGLAAGAMANKLDLDSKLATAASGVKDLNPKIATYSCALVAAALTAWSLYHLTPGAKLKKARAINEQINKNPLVTIYANDAYTYNEAVLRLFVRDEYPLLRAFGELTLIDDLINEALAILKEALNDSYSGFATENDLDWEIASFELLKQNVNDRLCFIKYSQDFVAQKNSCNLRNFFQEVMSENNE